MGTSFIVYGRTLYWLALLCVSCAPKTSSQSHGADENVQTASITAADGGEITLKNGSGVSILPGSLAIDAEVTLETVPMPGEFSALQSSLASTALAVTAVGTTGETVEQASLPMTIALVLEPRIAMALTPADQTEELCAVLKTRGQKLFVWRKAQLDIDASAKRAKIQSTLFGTYALAYCGKKALRGFGNAAVAGLTGGTKSEAKVQIQAGFAQGLGPHGEYCFALVERGAWNCELPSQCATGSEVIAASAAASTKEAQALTLGFVAAAFKATSTKLLQIYLMDSATGCPFRVGENLESLDQVSTVRSVYSFAFSNEQLARGVSGTLGEEGPYKMGVQSLSIGGPGDAGTYPTFDRESLCVRSDIEGIASSTQAARIVDGKLQGVATWEMPTAVGERDSSKPSQFKVRIGAKCGLSTASPTPNFATLESYELSLVAGNPIYLTPVTLALAVSDERLISKKACLEVRSHGSVQRLAVLPLTLISEDLQVYLPYPSSGSGVTNPAYDFRIIPVADNSTCYSPTEPGQQTERHGVLLESRIVLSL